MRKGFPAILRTPATALGSLAAHPIMFLIVTAYGVIWWALDPDSFDWHGFATIAIWFMTLLIQRLQYRDTLAIQAKLDELLRAEKNARSDLARIDEREPEEIADHRAQAKPVP